MDPDFTALPRQEGVRHLDEYADAIAGVDLATARATMEQVLEDGQRLLNDGMRLLALDVDDEADTARVVFVGRIVQTWRVRDPEWGRIPLVVVHRLDLSMLLILSDRGQKGRDYIALILGV
jgi:hypothetical protein